MTALQGSIQLLNKSAAWFTANPTLVLLDGQIAYLDDQSGTYKKGDGTTQLSALSFLGGNGGGGGTWGSITGLLNDQTDLQAALDLKAPKASPTFTGTVVLPATTNVGGDDIDLDELLDLGLQTYYNL